MDIMYVRKNIIQLGIQNIFYSVAYELPIW